MQSNNMTSDREMNMNPLGPPPNSVPFNPLPANYYQLRLKWGCSESCAYGCGGEAWFDLDESADASFNMLKTVGGIKQFHQISITSSDPYQASLVVNNQPLGTSTRLRICGAPQCDFDQVILKFANGTALGMLRARGDCSMVCNVLNHKDALAYSVEVKCC